MSKVVVIGGGIAGLSAAHELIERGFEVDVYEAKSIPGGKARSIPVKDTGTDGRKDLPGEHGFRFFPSFYKHIVDTMQRIPYKNNENGVADNLVNAPLTLYSTKETKDFLVVNDRIKNIHELRLLIENLFVERLGISEKEFDEWVQVIWQIFTSCDDRRTYEYEKIGWWEFIDADKKSQYFRDFVVDLPRTMVAAKPKQVSMKTGGNLFLQLLLDVISPFRTNDRLLNGPTNEVWINPWLEYISDLGVHYTYNSIAKEIKVESGKINSVVLEVEGKEKEVTGDYFILAVPVEVASSLINRDMTKLDPSLANIRTLSGNVAWMNGLQYFLNQPIDIVKGHTMYTGTPWALTSVSQKQFWEDIDLSKYGDGTTKGILSVDISDWDSLGILHKKPAKACTPKEIAEETWHQLKLWLNDSNNEILKDEYINSWFLDPGIQQVDESPEIYRNRNAEPLLVNTVNTWHLRPEAYTRIPNLLLAADYVRTNTDLATMESANEAARRAVNVIIDRSKSNSKYCKIWKLSEPAFLKPWKLADKKRWEKGLPWKGDIPLKPSRLSKLFTSLT